MNSGFVFARAVCASCVAGLAMLLPAQAAGPLVDVQWLGEHINDSRLVIIDLRKKEDFEAGHIPGAVNATYGEFGWRDEVDGVVGQLPDAPKLYVRVGILGISQESDVVIVPYGEDGTDIGAGTRVYWTLKVLGHEDVHLLDGGFRSWKQAGLELETGEVPPETVGPYGGDVDNMSLRIDSELLQKQIEAGNFIPVDARPYEQWSGQEKHPKARIPGAIPTALRLPYEELVDPETGLFRSAEQIEAVAKKYGLELDGKKPLAAYCNTGHWASIAWFALSEVVGRKNVKLYDGSMVAWTQDSDRPLINAPTRLEQLIERILGGG
ncbi:MAG: sulfurtransferase [Betaproteobacteria bacterium]|nr:sulfurtransferase [Betaproteobacteria bacterium]